MGPDMPQRALTDLATVAAASTSPWWLTLVSYGYQAAMAAGAFALLILRIAIAWREWRSKKEQFNGR